MNLQKYARQTSLKAIGMEGQKKLLEKTILIVGLGGTGSAAADLFSRLGVKKLIMIDRDRIEDTNIHRQILYNYSDIGSFKAETAANKVMEINPDIEVEFHNNTFDSSKINLIENADLVYDGTDNMTTRFIINDACNKFNKPWVFTSANEFYGEVKGIMPGKTSCYACYNKKPEHMPSCAVTGVINTLPVNISTFAVNIGMKIMLGENINGDLYFIDVYDIDMHPIKINKNPECRSCSKRKYDYLTPYYSNMGKSILS